MKTDNTNIVAQCTLKNGKVISLSNTNNQNEGFEVFKERFEEVAQKKTNDLQNFIILLNID